MMKVAGTQVVSRSAMMLAFAACSTATDNPPSTFDIPLQPASPFVTLESELLGQPTDLSLDGSGRLWVADALAKRVIALNPDGSLAQSIGQEGDGPGEFRSPVIVAASDSLVRVIDSRHMRVQDYAPDGTHLRDHSVPTPFIGAAGFSLDGKLVLPTLGRDSQLASLRTVTDTTTTQLGPAVSSAPAGFDFTAMKQVIAEGRVPDQFRNQITSIVGQSGAVWLLVQAEAEIRKYTDDGPLVWTHKLIAPEIDGAYREFFRRNAEEQDPSRMYALTTMRAAQEVRGSLWVLILGEASHPTAFYLLDVETGAVRGRLTVTLPSPPSKFVIDAERRRLYLALSDEASIMTVDLADLKVLGWGDH
jgi:hypothetical protein